MSWNEGKQTGKRAAVVLLAVISLLLALSTLTPLSVLHSTLQAAPASQESPLSPLVTDMPADEPAVEEPVEERSLDDAPLETTTSTDGTAPEATSTSTRALPVVADDNSAGFGAMIASGQISLVLIGALLLGILATVIAVLRRN